MSDVWASLHRSYESQDWINRPSLFAEAAAQQLPPGGILLELGAGQGQDSRYFAQLGHTVISADIEASAIERSRQKVTDDIGDNISFLVLDIASPLPFQSGQVDVVYAHLSLHYFDEATTQSIFDEIYRVLKPGGVLAFLCNSQGDPEYGTGEELELDYFMIDQTAKRYFSVESAARYTHRFKAILLDDDGETYKDADKGVHNLIRFVGTKKAG